jgi:hypothetical protein
MEQDVAGSRDGVAASRQNLSERVKLRGPWRSKKLVPCVGPESNNAREARLNVPKLDGADKPGKARAE